MSTESDVVIEKCRELWKQVAIEEREEEGYKDHAKACRKRIENKIAEIRSLCMENHQQTEIPLTSEKWKCAGCEDVFTESPGESHVVTVPDPDDPERPKTYRCGPVTPYIEGPKEETAPAE